MSQFARFVATGVFNTLVGYAVIFGCMYLAGIGPAASNAIGYAVGLVVSFALNRNFTFRSDGHVTDEFVRFLACFGIAYLLNLLALVLLVHVLGVHAGVSQVLAGVVYVVAGYFLNKHYVFRTAHSGRRA